jgi:isopenicillin-N epimerase
VSAAVATVLRSVPLGRGDEIITTSHGYAAVAVAVDHACAAAGATHTVVPLTLTAGDNEIVAAIGEAATPERTRLVIIDQIASSTARVIPAARVVALLRARGIPVLVDAAHAPGAHAAPVETIGADFWTGNLHKWLYAPRPAGFLTVAPAWRDRIVPPVVWADHALGFPRRLEMAGTLDYTAWLAAPAGLFVLRTLGAERVRTHNGALASYGQRVIGAALGLLSPADLPAPGHVHASMRVLPLPVGVGATYDTAYALRTRLFDELKVSVAVNPWQGRGLLRISAQVYNHADEYDRLAAGLPRLLSALR